MRSLGKIEDVKKIHARARKVLSMGWALYWDGH